MSTGPEPTARPVVVLGHTGFVGRALVTTLARAGAVRGVSSADLDLAADPAVERLVSCCAAGAVLVVAAAPRASQDTLEAFIGNAAIGASVARLIASGRVAKCVYLSTASVYGDGVTNVAIDEATPPAPSTYYGVGKLAAEGVVRRAAAAAGVPLVVLRPCRVYGPGDSAASYGPSAFVRAIVARGAVTLYGDGKELRDHVFVDDLARLVVACVTADVVGTFNVAGGRSHTYQELIDMLRMIVPTPFEVRFAERTRPRVDQGFDVTRLRRAFPDVAWTGLEAGLRATVRGLEPEPRGGTGTR